MNSSLELITIGTQVPYETKVSQIISYNSTPNTIFEVITEKITEPMMTSANNSVTNMWSTTVPNYTENKPIDTKLTSVSSNNTIYESYDKQNPQSEAVVVTTDSLINNMSSINPGSNHHLAESVIYGRPTTKQPVETTVKITPLTTITSSTTPSTTTPITTTPTPSTTRAPSSTLGSTMGTVWSQQTSAKPNKKPMVSAKAGMKCRFSLDLSSV